MDYARILAAGIIAAMAFAASKLCFRSEKEKVPFLILFVVLFFGFRYLFWEVIHPRFF